MDMKAVDDKGAAGDEHGHIRSMVESCIMTNDLTPMVRQLRKSRTRRCGMRASVLTDVAGVSEYHFRLA